MSSDRTYLGLNLGAIGVVAAIIGFPMRAFGPPWFLVVILVIWLLFSVLAAFLMSKPEMRAFLAGTLRHPNYTQIYTRFSKSGVMWVWNRLCDPVEEKASWFTLFRATLTWRLYDKALLLAVAYPILLLVGQWVVTGAEGRVGSFVVLPAAETWSERMAFPIMIMILTAGVVGQKMAAASPRPTMRKAAGWLIPVAFAFAGAVAFAVAVAFAFAGAVAFAFAVAGAFAGAVAGAFAGAFAVAFASAFAVAFAGAFAVIFAVIFAVEFMDKRGMQGLARALLTFAVLVALLIGGGALDWSAVSEEQRSLFLFLAALPLFNALFDAISYAFTLSLIRRGLRARLPVFCALADLALACLLFLGLGATLVVVVHGLNQLAGVPFVDLQALFGGVDAAPAAYIWLYLMLFSTILPTALHGSVSLLGLQGLCLRPWRRKVASLVDAAHESPLQAIFASFGLGLVWTLPAMCLVTLGWIIWHFGKDLILAPLGLYFDLLLRLAATPIGAI